MNDTPTERRSVLGLHVDFPARRNTRPVIATSYAYVNPGLAVILGAVISGELVGVTTVVANVLMVLAIWLALARSRTRA